MVFSQSVYILYLGGVDGASCLESLVLCNSACRLVMALPGPTMLTSPLLLESLALEPSDDLCNK